MPTPRPRSEMERFWEKADKSAGPDGCWLWTASTDRKGYGRFTVYDIPEPAHRIAYRTVVGRIPSGLMVLHHCDNPPCVNPSHLFVGTAADNAADRDAKGRTARGARHGHTKLTANHVFAIRNLLALGVIQTDIAAEFGISRASVSDIKARRRWGWL